MRLRQLARKLGVHPDKILTLLADSGHQLENEANSKLTEEQVKITEEHFPPPVIETEEETTTTLAEAPAPVEIVVPIAEETPAPVESTTEELIEEISIEEIVEEKDPDLEHLEVPFGPPAHATSQKKSLAIKDDTEELPEPVKKVVIQLEEPKPEVKVYNAIEEDEEFINAELIKTEKPVLEGLKVVGKIELPEPKKPAEKTEEGETEAAAERPIKKVEHRNNDRNDRGRGRNGKNQRQRLSPLEYERQKAERLAKKKKQEAERKLKQKREEHYRTTLEAKARAKAKAKAKKTTPAVKPKKQVKREEEAIAPLPINGMSRPKPVAPKAKKQKGPLKRFWGWLNGESDQFK